MSLSYQAEQDLIKELSNEFHIVGRLLESGKLTAEESTSVSALYAAINRLVLQEPHESEAA